MKEIVKAGAAMLLFSLAACANWGNDRTGMGHGSVHGGDYTASGSSGMGTAGQGDFNANTNGANFTGGVSASTSQGLVGTGSASGH